MESSRPRFWNIWWTLTIISATLTALVLVLEGLGMLRDFGLVLSGLGVLITFVFGLTASTRSSLTEFRADVSPRLDRVDMQLTGLGERLDRVIVLLDERLPRPRT